MRVIVRCLICIGMLGCAFLNNLLAADQPKKDAVLMEQTDQRELFSFSESYKDPVIALSRETGIPGLKIIFVYDKAWEAEDPLIPAAWLELKSKEKLKLNEAGIMTAFKELNFIPKNESEALCAARVYIQDIYDSYSNEKRIIFDEEDPFPAPTMSFEYQTVTQLRLTKPSVIREGSNFKVDLYVYNDPKEFRRFNPDHAKPSISHEQFLIGPETFRIIKSEVIWPDDMKLFTSALFPAPANNESFLDSIKQAAQFSIWGGRIRTASTRLHRLLVPPAKGFGRWQITSQSRPFGGEPARDWQIWNLAEGPGGDELFVVNLHEYDSVPAAHLALLETLASITSANVDFTPAVSGPGDVLILDYMARDNLVVHLASVRPVDKATRLELLRSIDDWLLQD